MSTVDSLSLSGKVAIITGSGRENGIGAGIALTLARAGALVVINYVSDTTAPRAAQVVKTIEAVAGKGSVLVVQADLGSIDGAKKIIDETLAGFHVDHIDIIVNNAGWASFTPALLVDPGSVVKTFNVNVFGPLYIMQAAVPHMPRGGRIVNIGTIASKMGLTGNPVFIASKAAVDAMSFSMAQELGRGKGITINTVAPGPVYTDLLPQDFAPAKQLGDSLIALTRAEERPGTVNDIADVVLFLASEKSRWITGQWISVSGGITGFH